MSSAEFMIVEIDTAFLINGPVSRISECMGFWGVSAAIVNCCVVPKILVEMLCAFPSLGDFAKRLRLLTRYRYQYRECQNNFPGVMFCAQISLSWRGVSCEPKEGKFLAAAAEL